jgi:hypothetical protein
MAQNPNVAPILQSLLAPVADNPSVMSNPDMDASLYGSSGHAAHYGGGSLLGESIKGHAPPPSAERGARAPKVPVREYSGGGNAGQGGMLPIGNGSLSPILGRAGAFLTGNAPADNSQPVQGPVAPNPSGGSSMKMTHDQTLDAYEQALAPKDAAEFRLKRMEFESKQAQMEADQQQKELQQTIKNYQIGGKDTSAGDVQERQASQQKAAEKTKPETPADAALKKAVDEILGTPSVSSAAPTSIMGRLMMQRHAEPYAQGMKFKLGQHVNFGGRIHQVIGSDPQGQPLFSDNLLKQA